MIFVNRRRIERLLEKMYSGAVEQANEKIDATVNGLYSVGYAHGVGDTAFEIYYNLFGLDAAKAMRDSHKKDKDNE